MSVPKSNVLKEKEYWDVSLLIDQAEGAADYYNKNPGLRFDWRIIPDLYNTIARLARIIERMDAE